MGKRSLVAMAARHRLQRDALVRRWGVRVLFWVDGAVVLFLVT